MLDGVTLQLGQEQFIYGKALGNILNGQVIQFAGVQGNHILVKPAVPAEVNNLPSLILGIASENILNNNFGYVTTFGKVNDVFTAGYTVAGQYIYYDSNPTAVPGSSTPIKPIAPYSQIIVGEVIKLATGASENGKFVVRVDIRNKFEELSNVKFTNISENDVFVYNAAGVVVNTKEVILNKVESVNGFYTGTKDNTKALLNGGGEVALNSIERTTNKGAASGYAPLDATSKVPTAYLPSYVDDVIEGYYKTLDGLFYTEIEYINLIAGETGKIYVSVDVNKSYRWTGSVYIAMGGGEVDSVNNMKGVVTLDFEDVGAAPAIHTHEYSTLTGLPTPVFEVTTEAERLALTTMQEGNMCFVTTTSALYIYFNEVWINFNTFNAGGSTVTLTNLTDDTLYSAPNAAINLEYNFVSLDIISGQATGNGTAEYFVNDVKVFTSIITQGDVLFDISSYLTRDVNTVVVKVTDTYGVYKTLTYSVNIINIALTSTFNYTQIFTGAFTFRYVPFGAFEKTIHFLVDDIEIGTVITSYSNREMSYSIPAQTHGSHTLKVYAVYTQGAISVQSNTLFYDLICTEVGETAPIITTQYISTSAEQYTTLNIKYEVYDPSNNPASVALFDGTNTINVSVDRKEYEWNYRADVTGALQLTLTCGLTVKTINVLITPSSINVEAETNDLELYLTSTGRSNNETTKAVWEYEDISCTLSNFNFVSDGWLTDSNGDTVLKVSGLARVTIPLKMFENDFRSTGKTIEFEFATSNVLNYDSTLISCFDNTIGFKVTAQNATIKSEQAIVTTQFKEDERVRIAFVIEQNYTGSFRLIYTYINGIISGISQYPIDDNFQQAIPLNITMGASDCTLSIYNIRTYNAALNKFQVLNNYIADLANINMKSDIYNRNQVFDAYGDIVYDDVLAQIPCMIITGTLPTIKGNKTVVQIDYANTDDLTKSFTASNVSLDIQGTSSQYYPRKNYKFKIQSGLIYTNSWTPATKYKLRDTSIEENTFTIKTDFAESSGTHNTGMAKYIENSLRASSILTPVQTTENYIRTTVDGFPIVVFHKDTIDSEPTFLGKYNFNNDKGNNSTFGFTNGAECWEFLNNNADRCLFKSDDFSTDEWQLDFESRYPSDYFDKTNLEILSTWIVSTDTTAATDAPITPTTYGGVEYTTDSAAYRLAKFKAECSLHFNMNNLKFYYLITETFAMVDQRAKNMMFASWGNEGSGEYKWYPIFYDNDTCLGINNEGALSFSFNVEGHDIIGTKYVFNGEASVLWNNLENAFGDDLATMFQDMRSGGVLTYNAVTNMLNVEQAAKWCEQLYNQDAQFKYIDPMIEEGNSTYLYEAQGSRVSHRRWWLANRFNYMDSKYNAGDYLGDYITMRLYTPAVWQGVTPNADFDITPYNDLYLRVLYGSYGTVAIRATHNVVTTIDAPTATFNDTETIIYGAGFIKSIGNLAGKYAGTVDISKATKLEELIIGSGEAGYTNTNLTGLSFGSNVLLRILDVQNCPNLTAPIDVTTCPALEEVYANGTSTTSVKLPNGGVLNTLSLPTTIANLTLMNQQYLTTFSLPSIAALSTIRVEGTPAVDTQTIVEDCMALGTRILNRLRVTGVDWTFADEDLMLSLVGVGGLNENGENISIAYISGDVTITAGVPVDNYDILVAAFPAVTFHCTVIPKYVRTITITYGAGDPPVNAFIIVDGITYNANAQGVVIFDETNDAITGTASADSSTTVSFSYAAIGMDTAYTITIVYGHQITTAADLVTLRNGVNSNATFTFKGKTIPALALNTTFLVMNNIDMSTVCSSSVGSWAPIGSTSTIAFKGLFYGQGYTISNLYSTTGNLNAGNGLFGNVTGTGATTKAIIDGLTLTNVYLVAAGLSTGAIAATINTFVEVTNCITYGTIMVSTTSVKGGGIVGIISGATNLINNCVNNCNVSVNGAGSSIIIGGIVAYNTGNNPTTVTISNCTNNGTIGNSTYSPNNGGILGYAGGCAITKCTNNGTIYSGANAGGIFGSSSGYAGTILGCVNNGGIVGAGNVGGIGAYIAGAISILYCVNYGTLNHLTSSTYIGGIAAQAAAASTYIKWCLNNGSITTNTTTYKGGIAGKSTYISFTANWNNSDLCAYAAIQNADITGQGVTINTSNIQGTALRTGATGDGWTDQHWIFAANQYPVPTGV